MTTSMVGPKTKKNKKRSQTRKNLTKKKPKDLAGDEEEEEVPDWPQFILSSEGVEDCQP